MYYRVFLLDGKWRVNNKSFTELDPTEKQVLNKFFKKNKNANKTKKPNYSVI